MVDRDDLADERGTTPGLPVRAEVAEPTGFVDPKTIGLHDDGTIALLVRVQVPDQPGVLHALTRVIFEHRANITYVDIGDRRQRRVVTYFELSDVHDPVQAGVMTVMLVARTARFDIRRQRGRRY